MDKVSLKLLQLNGRETDIYPFATRLVQLYGPLEVLDNTKKNCPLRKETPVVLRKHPFHLMKYINSHNYY
jgi:hypothetical protein